MYLIIYLISISVDLMFNKSVNLRFNKSVELRFNKSVDLMFNKSVHLRFNKFNVKSWYCLTDLDRTLLSPDCQWLFLRYPACLFKHMFTNYHATSIYV